MCLKYKSRDRARAWRAPRGAAASGGPGLRCGPSANSLGRVLRGHTLQTLDPSAGARYRAHPLMLNTLVTLRDYFSSCRAMLPFLRIFCLLRTVF